MRLIAGFAAAALMLALPGAALGQGDPLRGQQWNLDMVEADAAHGISRGAGAVVAVMDSGAAASHPDLGGRLLGGRDFVDNDGTPQDGNGHGTHVSGIVAANAGNGVWGVERGARRPTSCPCACSVTTAAVASTTWRQGIDWAAANGAHMINLSLGEDVALIGGRGEFAGSDRRALDRGIVVVAASGNNGLPACEQPRGGAPSLRGRCGPARMRSFFSSFGRGLGVVAPGGSGAADRGRGHPVHQERRWRRGAGGHLAGRRRTWPELPPCSLRRDCVARRWPTASWRRPRTPARAGPDAQFGAGIVNARAAVSGLPAGGGSTRARVYVPRIQRLRGVLRRGLRVRCLAPRAGRCRASATRRGPALA